MSFFRNGNWIDERRTVVEARWIQQVDTSLGVVPVLEKVPGLTRGLQKETAYSPTSRLLGEHPEIRGYLCRTLQNLSTGAENFSGCLHGYSFLPGGSIRSVPKRPHEATSSQLAGSGNTGHDAVPSWLRYTGHDTGERGYRRQHLYRLI